MAEAEAPFRTSIRSMSAGLRSAIRFTCASWVSSGFDPWLAAVTAFWLDGIAMSLMITPSTT